MKKYLLAFSAIALLSLMFFLLPRVQAAPDARPAPSPHAPAAIGGGSWDRIWRSAGAVFDLDCVSETDCIAVGEDGLILITRDGGETWRQEILDQAGDMQGVSVNDDGLILAAAAQGAIFRSEDRGLSWQAVAAPVSADLHDVWLLDDGRAWAVGDGGAILHSEDGGRTWSAQSSGAAGPLYAVQFVDGRTGYAAGEKGAVLKTVDGGASWTPLSGAFPGWARIYALSFVDADAGCVAGQAGHLYCTEDGGQTWRETPVSMGDGFLATDIFALSMGQGFGVLGGSRGVIATRSDGGAWRVQTAVGGDERDVWAVFAHSDAAMWAAGAVKDAEAAAFFVIRSDDGAAFHPVAGDYGPRPIFHEAAAPSRDVAFVVGSDGAIGRTLDGGDTWRWQHFQSKFPTPPIISGVSCPTVDDCWISGQNPGHPGFLYATHDRGETWEWQDPPDAQWPWLYDVEMVDAMNGHAAANPYMFYTTDGGTTWSQSSVEGHTANVEIAMANPHEGWTAQRNLGHRYTTNGGKTWRRLMPYTEHAGLFFFGVEALDANRDGGVDMGWLVGCSWYKAEERCLPNTGVVFFAQSNDDPGYAQPLPPDTPPLYTITMLDSRRGWVGGEDGALLYTETGGARWQRVDAPTAALITDIAFFEDKIGFAATYAGEILRFRGPGRSLGGFTQSTPITVDGAIWDWHFGGALYLDAANAAAVIGDEPYPAPEQLSANFYSRWTDDMLYLMAEIADDVVVPEDGVRFALDGLDDDIWGNEGDLLLRVTAAGGFEVEPSDAAIAHAVGRSDTGWIVELGIPAARLGRDALAPGDSMGLNIELEDQDGAGVGHTLIMEDRRLLGHPAIWGTLRLMDDTLALQNGLDDYQGAADTFLTIWGEDGRTPHGGDEHLWVRYTGGREFDNALLRFEMPSWLREDASMHEARLAMYVIMSFTEADFTIGAYRLLQPWNPDTAVWYERDVDTPWGKPGALEPGVDYDPQPLDILTIPDSPRNAWLEWDISDAAAYWADHPDENYGILLKGLNARRDITAYSSDYNGDPAQRPKLLVDFTLNPRPTPTPTPTPTPQLLYMPLIRR